MIAIYARQSVYNEDSLSLQEQIEQCQNRISKDEPFKVYQDAGYSGKNTQRPDFERMILDVERGLIHKVIAYKLDRFTRSVLDFSKTMEIFEKYDVEFLSATEGLNNSDKMGKAMLSIIVVFAQLERNNIIDRVRDTYYQRAKQGYYLGGPAPFGFTKKEYTINGKKTACLVPDEKVLDPVQEMFRKYAYDETVTLGVLKKWLDSCGVTTGRGLSWTSAAMSRIIRNPVYVKADADIYSYLHDIKGATINNDVADFTGENACYVYTKGQDTHKDKFAHMSTAFVTIAPHQGIVDSDTWIRCQHRLDKNRVFKGAGKGSYTWLSGIMKCGYCGYAMTVTNDKKRGAFYLSCGGRKQGTCFERKETIQAFELETVVEEMLFKQMKKIKDGQDSEPIQDSRLINDIKIQLVTIDQRINTLTENLASMTGGAVGAVNKAINNELDKRNVLAKELDTALSEQQDKMYSQYNIDECIQHWGEYDIEEKKRIARIFIEKVLVEDSKVIFLPK